MPISKNGKSYYTKEQYRKAKYESNALEYALQKGYHLIKEGKYYHMDGHDSMIFAPNGMWYWNSRGLQGKALDFMVHYEGKTPTEAVLELAAKLPTEIAEVTRKSAQKNLQKEKIVQFLLPEHAKTSKRLLAYLCGKRKLEKSVVAEMMQQELLYEGVTEAKGKSYHNAVFVYRDPSGVAVGAFLRGMGDIPFRGDVEGSVKHYGWLVRRSVSVSGTVYVFEAAIDAASQLCLARLQGFDNEKVDRLSLEGVSSMPLQNYLELHPCVKRIVLMLDNDKGGHRATERIRATFESDYAVEVQLPPVGKDWNDALIAIKKT